MMRRMRLASGFTLLFGLSLSILEGVAASACATEGDGETSMGGMAGMEAEDMGAMPMDHDCPPGHRHDSPAEHESDASCPFALGAAQGCLAAPSLPTGGAAPSLPSPEDDALVARLAAAPARLTIPSIFRPPKA
jgi:hypothetical protein